MSITNPPKQCAGPPALSDADGQPPLVTVVGKGMSLDQYLCSPDESIEGAVLQLNENRGGILLVVDEERRLLGTISDGDYRRAMLAHVPMTDPVSRILDIQAPAAHERPLMRPVDTPCSELLALMNRYGLRHIPLIDADRRVVDIAMGNDLVSQLGSADVMAVVMAGGFGTRLRPLTETTPKPMLPVAGKPLLHHIVSQLSSHGIQDVSLTTHYKPEIIRDFFGSGEKYGVNINYVNEDKPLGTAGAMALLPDGHQTLLVINGDILTQCNFASMIDFHRQHGAELTVGVRKFSIGIPYGVVDFEGTRITGLREKPTVDHFINSGIYLVERSALEYVPSGEHFHMTHLIESLLADGKNVCCFPVTETWLDIGQMDDYTKAQEVAAGWLGD